MKKVTLKAKQNHDLIPGAEVVILTTITEAEYRDVYDRDLAWGKGYDEYTIAQYTDLNHQHLIVMPTEEFNACIEK